MAETYDGWAIIEIMGHRVRAGRVVMDDTPLLRIDIPTEDGEEITEFYGRSAIFSMRPCEEQIARDWAARNGMRRPVRPVTYREPDEKPALGAPDSDRFEDPDFDEVDEY